MAIFEPVPQLTQARLDASLADAPLDTQKLVSSQAQDAAPLEKAKTVLYLAYGSNLCNETFRGVRGIRPISQINVLVPSLRLTFDLPGIPYKEPCFANTALRTPDAEDYHKGRWHKGLVGVVYEVTLSDYAHIIATEGGGSAYDDILVDCYVLPPTDTVPSTPSWKPFKAHTLFAPLVDKDNQLRTTDRVVRPDPEYAQPSARYLKLITDGAAECNLPAEYQEYLGDIRTYTITSKKQEIGKAIFLAIWMPFILLIFTLSRKLQDKRGRSPAWLAKLSAMVFAVSAHAPPFKDDYKRAIGEHRQTRRQTPTTRESETRWKTRYEKRAIAVIHSFKTHTHTPICLSHTKYPTMCKSSTLHPFLAALPKCEHHLHLEGCLSPSLVFTLASKNNISLPSPDTDSAYTSVATLTERYAHFTSLDDFLAYYYRGIAVLVQPSDFEMLAWEYFTTAARDGVRHAEVFFDPQSHTERGVGFDVVVEGFNAARARAERELGISSRLVMCFLRHLPVASAAETMAAAVAGGYFENGEDGERGIAGLGLDSSEVGFRPELFQDMYREGGERGLRRTAHAGEEGDTTYISGALDTLHVERIDHGIRLTEDAELMRRVVDEKVLLTVCPLSNVCLQAVKDISQVPIRTFLDAGVRFSINSDDPAYFGGYILNNYCAVQDAFGLDMEDWRTIVNNSIQGSWIGEKRKSELLGLLDECMSKHSSLGSLST
ncbi:adenosine deaminase [Stemphylium lycopersici]|uniref:Adenine deaminase n=1 Tax=Stemphylium lycopersici TaxID=183478 RepID=A0A364MSD4_STELY|nr:adenosine deaminase [Stemphylium lycopersici]